MSVHDILSSSSFTTVNQITVATNGVWISKFRQSNYIIDSGVLNFKVYATASKQ